MDIHHLRKQARNLVRLYPELAAQHPTSITLSVAQSTIARVNGYPSWEAMLAQHEATPASQRASAGAHFDVSQHLHFASDGHESRLPTAYSKTTGNPTRYRVGVEAILSYKSSGDERKASAEDKKLDALFDRAFGPIFDTACNTIDARTRLGLLSAVQKSLEACPFCVETYARLTSLWFTNGAYEQVIEVVAPIAEQLLALIPTDRYVQVPYGYLDNRPFHRLMHGYVLTLDKLDLHADADRLALRMLALSPSDNIGFRFLSSRSLRAQSG